MHEKQPELSVGSFVRNMRCLYDGVCVVLEVRGDRLEVFTERGEFASIHAAHAAPTDAGSCLTPSGPSKLSEALEVHLRLRAGKIYFKAMRDGDEADQRGEWDESARCYRTALTIEENSGEARMKLAGVLRRVGEHESSLREYERLIRDGEGTALVHFGKAVCLERLAMFEEAAGAAEKAIELNEQLSDAIRLASALHALLSERHRERSEELELMRKGVVNPDGRLGSSIDKDQMTLFD